MICNRLLSPGHLRLFALKSRHCSTSGVSKANLPNSMLLSASMACGGLSCGMGLGIGSLAFSAGAPPAIALTALLPMALGSCYLPYTNVHSRSLVVSLSSMPLGVAASSLLATAAWPPVGTAMFVAGTSLAAGFSAFHIAASNEYDPSNFSAPDSPLATLSYGLGLWGPHTPWAHSHFRSVLKLFFYFPVVCTLPTLAALYGSWATWLWLVWLWKYSFVLSLASISTGLFLKEADSFLGSEVLARFPRLVARLQRTGHWLVFNHPANVLWCYAFYALPVMLVFYIAHKWRHGVSSSPFHEDEPPQPAAH
eukprot:NODE_2759_length_1099_cov_64.442387_g2634_i0.p1 GENE.NODE_2759_length_1099_cov_64.442387_g2634_i0~~NODE_2759_length_1099_cov_64.442387_g2634_i0.p1  ORF type:complete len:309 (+),score=46.63 NODE_2759_length_1099_cov_64.442387_g2634_i0:73-999(+)